MRVFIISLFLQISLFSDCIVPNILSETIKITENENSYLFWIRTNDTKSLGKFKEIIRNFNYRKSEDHMQIDCIESNNCINIVNTLISNNITNLDLGLFQINYENYPFKIDEYFDENLSYFHACQIIKEKIKIKKYWSWETLASYHSFTPELNKKYMNKLINNYIKLANK